MREYCDFIVWTSEDVQVERIYPNWEFWLDCVSCAELLFKNSILPKPLGNLFSRVPETQTLSSTPEHQSPPTCEVYCHCQGPEDGDMVGCDNRKCSHKWFHLSCFNLKI